MFSLLLAALALLLHATTLAAPSSNPQNSHAPLLRKSCMTRQQIREFQSHWPKLAGHGPVLIPCDRPTPVLTVSLSPAQIAQLARLYVAALGDEAQGAGGAVRPRGAGAPRRVRKWCMTEAQIKAFQSAWPKSGGIGPALMPCSPPESTDAGCESGS